MTFSAGASRTLRRRWIVLLVLAGLGASSTRAASDPVSELRFDLADGNWKKASKLLSGRLSEKHCPPSICDAARALLAAGLGDAKRADELARALAKQTEQPAPESDWFLNEVGVALFRSARGDRETLADAAALFRRAQSVHEEPSVNIRFNLARTLEALGDRAEAKDLDEQADADGMLINPSFTVLGDFESPEATRKVLPGAAPDH